MEADIAGRIAAIDGVYAVDRFRAYPITYEGMPAMLAGTEINQISDRPDLAFLPGENRSEIMRKLGTGDYAIVSEPFANKHHVRASDTIALAIAGRERRFQVLGVYYDYSAESGSIVLARPTLLRYLPDPALSSLAVYLKRGVDPERVRSQIAEAIGGRAIVLNSHAALRRAALEVFDRTFRITYALEAIAVFVAIMGIASALLAMVIDRRREFSLVRCLGAERKQIRKLILCEAGLLGLLSNAAGLALGTALSLVLIFVINKQSFGWTIQFHWPVMQLCLALTLIYAATVLAGLYPARAAMNLQSVEVLHED
jgi:putative ABC transport system permease protein